MIWPATELPIGEFLATLDEEIALLEVKRSQLAALAEALIKRDNETTEDLLKRMEATEQTQASVDQRLAGMRAKLAEAIGCPAGDLRLADLAEQLPHEQAQQLDARREKIILRGQELRQEHLKTAMMLAECSRVNRLLLDCMLPGGETVVTYGSAGADLWRSAPGLVDMES